MNESKSERPASKRRGAAAGRGPRMDRRVRRTRDALGDALVALMQEREFESITVADVLSRAGVSRSTFYAHFRDTDDLLLSDADEFFEATANALSERGEDSERVAPVRELFAHVFEMRAFLEALIVSGRVHANLELARGHFARGIERRLGELARARTLTAVQRAALGHAHAGALIALLLWWIRREPRESPAEMDELFHRTVWGGAWARGADPHAARRRH